LEENKNSEMCGEADLSKTDGPIKEERRIEKMAAQAGS